MKQLDEALRDFERDTAEHELRVLRDEGLYRHLRCAAPGTYIYGFDVVTWPGYLAIVGDAGDYLFSRIEDMFEFFGASGSIDPRYWGEKLQGPGSRMEYQYSLERYRQRVAEWLDGTLANGELTETDAADLKLAVQEQLLAPEPIQEAEARRLLDEFDWRGHRIDSWEWSLQDFDSRFLWCCHAIRWAIRQYRSRASWGAAA